MTERDYLKAEIEAKRNEIKLLNDQLAALLKADILLSDDKRQYREEIETVVVSKRPLKTRNDLVGRIYWKDTFVDMNTGEKVLIDRSSEVMRNGLFLRFV